MYRAIKAIYFVLALICLPVFIDQVMAQPIPPTPTAPIDGGISVLLAIGAVLGIRKLYKAGKK